ncbi:hypothetical protein QR680_016904 [Steinernema hermaphroditum]|uniref:Uncharacterized protein n=1 Tax=Steinernema hermaphroditum TaxID=289476 RepID=A0AA39HF43_9BILA|nr:hypothetical protein QR680_016904 [Steinernema hermaphroditum]
MIDERNYNYSGTEETVTDEDGTTLILATPLEMETVKDLKSYASRDEFTSALRDMFGDEFWKDPSFGDRAAQANSVISEMEGMYDELFVRHSRLQINIVYSLMKLIPESEKLRNFLLDKECIPMKYKNDGRSGIAPLPHLLKKAKLEADEFLGKWRSQREKQVDILTKLTNLDEKAVLNSLKESHEIHKRVDMHVTFESMVASGRGRAMSLNDVAEHRQRSRSRRRTQLNDLCERVAAVRIRDPCDHVIPAQPMNLEEDPLSKRSRVEDFEAFVARYEERSLAASTKGYKESLINMREVERKMQEKYALMERPEASFSAYLEALFKEKFGKENSDEQDTDSEAEWTLDPSELEAGDSNNIVVDDIDEPPQLWWREEEQLELEPFQGAGDQPHEVDTPESRAPEQVYIKLEQPDEEHESSIVDDSSVRRARRRTASRVREAFPIHNEANMFISQHYFLDERQVVFQQNQLLGIRLRDPRSVSLSRFDMWPEYLGTDDDGAYGYDCFTSERTANDGEAKLTTKPPRGSALDFTSNSKHKGPRTLLIPSCNKPIHPNDCIIRSEDLILLRHEMLARCHEQFDEAFSNKCSQYSSTRIFGDDVIARLNEKVFDHEYICSTKVLKLCGPVDPSVVLEGFADRVERLLDSDTDCDFLTTKTVVSIFSYEYFLRTKMEFLFEEHIDTCVESLKRMFGRKYYEQLRFNDPETSVRNNFGTHGILPTTQMGLCDYQIQPVNVIFVTVPALGLYHMQFRQINDYLREMVDQHTPNADNGFVEFELMDWQAEIEASEAQEGGSTNTVAKRYALLLDLLAQRGIPSLEQKLEQVAP